MNAAGTDRVTQSIIACNNGRDPQRLQRKFQLLREDAFAFFRGTCHLFYACLPRHAMFKTAPRVLACGDLHLENFGTYKGDNRLTYFDLNDFDEASVAPCTLELARFMSSLLVAAAHYGIAARDATKLCRTFCDVYRTAIIDGKPRWVERLTAEGMVEDLLASLRERKRAELLDLRTQLKKAKRRLVIDGKHALPATRAECQRVASLLARYGRTAPDPRFYRVLDAARRIAGNGSLGVERYVVLVEGKGSPDGNYLLDLKLALPSALAVHANVRQPRWPCEARRVVTIQRVMQAIAPARLAAIEDGPRSYVLKELQPAADRLDLAASRGRPARLESVISTMAEVVAWAQLRGCSRFGAAPVETLMQWGAQDGWQNETIALAQAAATRTLTQWKEYCVAYDAGKFALPA